MEDMVLPACRQNGKLCLLVFSFGLFIKHSSVSLLLLALKQKQVWIESPQRPPNGNSDTFPVLIHYMLISRKMNKGVRVCFSASTQTQRGTTVPQLNPAEVGSLTVNGVYS